MADTLVSKLNRFDFLMTQLSAPGSPRMEQFSVRQFVNVTKLIASYLGYAYFQVRFQASDVDIMLGSTHGSF